MSDLTVEDISNLDDDALLEKYNDIVDDSSSREDIKPADSPKDNVDDNPEKEVIVDNQEDDNSSVTNEEQDNSSEGGDENKDDGGNSEDVVDTKTEEKNEDSTPEMSLEDLQKELYAPLVGPKNTEIVLDNISDVRTLLQKGVGFDAKARELAELKKLTTVLSDNELLNTDSINRLVDISKHNPKAIADLIKQANLNVVDLDLQMESDDEQYVPTDHSIDDNVIELRSVLTDLKESPKYDYLLKQVDTWDTPSQDDVTSNPSTLKIINSHMVSGIYDQVVSVIDKERMLGRLPANTPFLQAYKHYGTVMEKANAFSQKQQSSNENGSGKDNTNQDIDKLRRAAAGTQANKSKDKTNAQSLTLADIAGLSDDEFLKKYTDIVK